MASPILDTEKGKYMHRNSVPYRVLVLIPFLLLFTGDNMAEQEKSNSQSVTFDDLSWLIGHWEGPGFGGTCEESWLPESGGSMLGTFKLVKDGKMVFCELMSLSFEDGSPVLKVKHFSDRLVAWEEKEEMNRFAFTEKTGDTIVFSGIRYVPAGTDSMDIIVDMKNKDGSIRQETITCTRK